MKSANKTYRKSKIKNVYSKSNKKQIQMYIKTKSANRTQESCMKAVFIAEKPSVAAEFAKALKLKTTRRDGYMESENAIVTWCVGHLVTMSYPECYDEKYKKWNHNDSYNCKLIR